MKTNATQRSLKVLRENGWTAHIVEKFLPARGTMKFPRRIDAFGIGDILAFRPPVGPKLTYHHDGGNEHYHDYEKGGIFSIEEGEKLLKSVLPGCIALVQCCPGASHAEHKAKILAIPEFHGWKLAGGRVFLQSWTKKGARGARKTWQMREEEL